MIDISSIPAEPGCYIYNDNLDRIIYIGKAKNLRKRVSNYFQKKDHDPKTTALVSHINSVDFIITKNEIEALILENNLIKKHSPKYNIDLKDSKRYAFILLTKEDFPRLLVARDKIIQGEYFGPFVSGQERDYIINFLKREFKLRTCKKFPKKPCLRYHIKLCEAPCVDYISKEDYSQKIDSIRHVLKGNYSSIVKQMTTEMKTYSISKDFEKALVLRERINAISHLEEKQNMERNKSFDEDVINYIVKNDKVYLILFNVYKGTLATKNEFSFEYSIEFLEEFIVQYYSEAQIPKEIILPEELDLSVTEFLSQKKGSNVTITVPQKGAKKELLELVEKNIEISFFLGLKKLEELKDELQLENIPYVIECFDISHLSGTNTVASMVQFRNAKPDKSNYRHYKIKTVDGIDDFSSIAEVVRRRYQHLIIERLIFPDLIVVDGGKGQLSSAVTEFQKLGIRIPIISIAKQFEEIYFPGTTEPLRLDKKSKALQLIQEIRDEAHRFAITYNRLLRKKEITDEF